MTTLSRLLELQARAHGAESVTLTGAALDEYRAQLEELIAGVCSDDENRRLRAALAEIADPSAIRTSDGFRMIARAALAPEIERWPHDANGSPMPEEN